MNGTWKRKWFLGWAGCMAVALLFLADDARAEKVDPFAAELQAKADDDPFALANKAEPRASKPEVAPKQVQPAPAESGLAKVIAFEVTVEPKEARPGQIIHITIKAAPAEGYHTYSFTKKTQAQVGNFHSQLLIGSDPHFKPLWPIVESEGQFAHEDGQVYLEHIKPFTLAFDGVIDAKTPEGPLKLPLSVKMQVCDKSKCIPGTLPLSAEVQVKGAPVALTAEIKDRLDQKRPDAEIVTPSGTIIGPDDSSDLFSFILAGIFWGAVSLITPCVFPMIPITVSYFLKQSDKEHHRPITMAAVYCGTIVVVLTIAAVALLSVFRALSVNPIMNFVIGGLFVFFSLSLFGMYEIELPSSLARFTSAREGKGGLLGTMFMALTFTIISFACVAPFLGGFGGTAANSNLTFMHRILGGLAFAVTFASPFFVLALFPTLLKKMPKSGSWLNTVKVVMGFLELAAALKFFRAGELVIVSQPSFFTYDLVLGLYVALSLLAGVYLLGLFRLPHDSPLENLTVPRMLFSLAFLGIAFYLAPALFKSDKGQNQRPTGDVFAWLDSFLLPDDVESDLPWTGSLNKGLEQARTKSKLVFVDFTGKTCTNCKLNERSVFSQPEFKSLLEQYELVQLYTDVVPNRFYSPIERVKFGNGTSQQQVDAGNNLKFQRNKFGTEALPLYVILEPLPNGEYREVGRKEGRITNQAAFAEFLLKPIEGNPVQAGVREERKGKEGKNLSFNWKVNFSNALAGARSRKKLVFVNFTALSDNNSKLNERKVFPLPEVRNALKAYEEVHLYIDQVPVQHYPAAVRSELSDERMREICTADAARNLELLRRRFGTEGTPFYAILDPSPDGDFKELARYQGRIGNPITFVRFLQDARKEQEKVAAR